MIARAAILAVVLALGASGAASAADALRIYSSLPLLGANRPYTLDVVRGERLALAEAGNAAGGHPIELVSLNDASRYSGGRWDPGHTYENAYQAAADERAIAYLGEYNSGASAISMPILNEANILQVSPSNTYVGLTRREGADSGEPQKYFPTGKRSYGRIAPADHLQAAATANLLASLGVKRVLLLDDAELYGAGLARMVRSRAIARGIEVRGPFHVRRGHWRSRVRHLAHRARADAMTFGGITDNHAAGVFNAAHAVAPKMTLIGADSVAESRFTRRLGAGTANRTPITNPTLAEAAYPPASQPFFAAFRAQYGHAPAPYAIYGYEAMNVVLGAIDAGDAERELTIDAFFAIRDRDSVLGHYSIDANGDTTLSTYGLWRVERGNLVFDRVIDSST